MAYKDPEQKKKKNKEWYEHKRKNNPDFKKQKKLYDAAYHKDYKNPNLSPERQREYVRAYRERNKETVRQNDREYKRKYYESKYKEAHKKYMAANPEKRKQYAEKYKQDGRTKNAQIKSRYGLTIQDISSMLKKQNGVCPICLESFDHRKRHIDHNHKTGKVRGLVHMQCNTLMGHAKDNPEVLERAAKYLREGI